MGLDNVEFKEINMILLPKPPIKPLIKASQEAPPRVDKNRVKLFSHVMYINPLSSDFF